MKKQINALATMVMAIAAIHHSQAQTNTFPANGNVGIGTLAPAYNLTVSTASNVVGIAHTNGMVRLGTVINNTGGYFGTATNHPLFLRTNNNGAQLTLLQSGNVGIATSTPRSKLEVNGSDAYINSVRVGVGGRMGDSTYENTCLGKEALQNIWDFFVPEESPWAGRFNTAIGRAALRDNGLGGYNTAVGAYALEEGVNDGNTAIGTYSLRVSRGRFNSALGMQSLYQNDEGDYNAAVGFECLYSNTDGNSNTAVGHRSLYRNTTADDNTAVGRYSMYQNTTGTLNTAIGYRSLDSNTIGNGNTAAGIDALLRNKTGTGNTAAGSYALSNLNSANYNTAVGRYALTYSITGGTNTAIGYFASPSTSALSNTTSLGYNARPTASNQVRIGNSFVTSIGGYANWTNVSDGRVKRNIKNNVPGLDFINLLLPVTYTLHLDAADKIINTAMPETENDKIQQQQDATARAQKQAITYTGFIAQDVEKAAQKINYDFSGVDAPKSENDLYGIRYAEFVVPLVKAVQELSKINDEKNKQIDYLQSQVDELKNMVTELSKSIPTKVTSQNIPLTSALLEQNTPNPFSNSTNIRYALPLQYTNAKLVITDKSGKVIREVNISGSGKGNININTTALINGTYQYALFVNNVLIDSKQMLLSK